MEKDHLSRKLAVILHADVVGSTALVQKNEMLAHERIQATFHKFARTIKTYGGLTRELRGDALVAEFNRASDAVTAALAFQTSNEEVISEIRDEIKPYLRIGISLGEVIVADDTITGAGVVLAQRLEQLAEPGGVIAQGSVAETVPDRMPFEFESLGERTLKGFEQPIRTFAVCLQSGQELPKPELDFPQKDSETGKPKIPEVPSIAVLPFTNLSNDEEQEFFSDGMAEDITTALSKVSGLMVIARHSTFKYKDNPADVKIVGQELGVQFVLEGSIRKAGKRLRINAQLIDTETGQHKWVERYDRVLEDIFTVQDEITRNIVSELDVNLRLGEQARLWSSGTENFDAWQCVRMGSDLLGTYRPDIIPEAMRLLNRATELDPNYAEAWALLAAGYFRISEIVESSEEERNQALKSSRECVNRALEIDSSCPSAYGIQALDYLNLQQFDEAARSANKGVEIAPNHARSLALSAMVLNKCGQPKRAFERIRKAMRLSPYYPIWFLFALAQASRSLGKVDETIDAYSEVISREPDSLEGHIGLAEILSEAEMMDMAKSSAAEILRISPDFSVSKFIENISYRDPNEITRLKESLLKAGLPD